MKQTKKEHLSALAACGTLSKSLYFSLSVLMHRMGWRSYFAVMMIKWDSVINCLSPGRRLYGVSFFFLLTLFWALIFIHKNVLSFQLKGELLVYVGNILESPPYLLTWWFAQKRHWVKVYWLMSWYWFFSQRKSCVPRSLKCLVRAHLPLILHSATIHPTIVSSFINSVRK